MKAVEPTRTPVGGAQIWPLSVPAYRALAELRLIPKNTELLYGFVYQKMPKSPFHCFILNRLLRLIQAILPAGCLLRTEQPITCQDSEPEPDVSVVRGSEDDFRHNHPGTAELVIEVCVTSHEYDRSKLRAYASVGVKEVWLVLAPEKQIEVHSQPGDGQFAEQKTHSSGERLACVAVPEFALDLDALFAK